MGKGRQRKPKTSSPASGDAGQDSGECDLMHELIIEFSGQLEEEVIRLVASSFGDDRFSHDDVRRALLEIAATLDNNRVIGLDSSVAHHNGEALDGGAGARASSRMSGTYFESQASHTSVTDSWMRVSSSRSHSSDCSIYEMPSTSLPDTHEFTLEDGASQLRPLFPSIKNYTINRALERARGNVNRALDELLSHVTLEEDSLIPKGIDGFFVADNPDGFIGATRGKAAGFPSASEQKKKARTRLDIDYTLALPQDEDTLVSASGTVAQTTTISVRQNSSLLLSGQPAFTSSSRPPLDELSTALGGWQRAARRKHSTKDLIDMDALTCEGSSHSFRSATTLARSGGDKKLLHSQVAAFYARRAHEQAELSKAATLESYHRKVEAQRTANQIDLHGVPVAFGVNIARAHVQRWWYSLDGEYRARLAKTEGFTIITGSGQHSASGICRMRQGVKAALTRDGWKFEDFTARFYVTGRLSTTVRK